MTILYGKGYNLHRMLAMTRRFCIGRQVGYGTKSSDMMKDIESKLTFMVSEMNDLYYVSFFADTEKRARTIVKDMLMQSPYF